MAPKSGLSTLNFTVALGAAVALKGSYLEACVATFTFTPWLSAIALAFEVYIAGPIIYRDREVRETSRKKLFCQRHYNFKDACTKSNYKLS